MFRRFGVLLASLLVLSSSVAYAATTDSGRADQGGSHRNDTLASVGAGVVPDGHAFLAGKMLQQANIDLWNQSLWLHQVEANNAWAAAEAAARKPQPSVDREAQGVVPAAGRSAGGVGDCTGFAIPDYIIQRESGGDPNAHNPSGAHGCSQTLMSHYTGGQCQGMDPYTVEGQRECTYVLSDGGTNLAPWAMTR